MIWGDPVGVPAGDMTIPLSTGYGPALNSTITVLEKSTSGARIVAQMPVRALRIG